MDNAVAIAAIGLTGTIAAGFFALIRQQNKTHERLALAMDKMAVSSQEVAKQTKKGADEARERNGHLAELVVQQGETFKVITDTAANTVIDAVQNVQQQNVEHQHVVNEVVQHEVKSKES